MAPLHLPEAEANPGVRGHNTGPKYWGGPQAPLGGGTVGFIVEEQGVPPSPLYLGPETFGIKDLTGRSESKYLIFSNLQRNILFSAVCGPILESICRAVQPGAESFLSRRRVNQAQKPVARSFAFRLSPPWIPFSIVRAGAKSFANQEPFFL